MSINRPTPLPSKAQTPCVWINTRCKQRRAIHCPNRPSSLLSAVASRQATGELPCPIMLFHGNADRTVPFDKALLENMGLWGSNFIARQLQVKQSPYYFYLAEDAGHEMANIPMENNRYDILGFLDRFVIRSQKVFINTTETIPGKPQAKKDFTIQDYIQNNL